MFEKTALILLGLALPALALPQTQRSGSTEKTGFEQVAESFDQRLKSSVEALGILREEVAAEEIPLSRRLSELERELSDVRAEYQEATRTLDDRTLDLTNIKREIKNRNDAILYLGNLLGEYQRKLESRLHIAERQRYANVLETARLATENDNLDGGQVFGAQSQVLVASLERLENALGGDQFRGQALDSTGRLTNGNFVLLGPAAIFRSGDGKHVGTAERLESLQPSIVPFAVPEDSADANDLAATGSGRFPLDTSGGRAHQMAAIDESFIEHVKKGGPVMIPIFAMAAAALLVALFKWLGMAFVKTPSRRRIRELLDAISRRDEEGAQRVASKLKGPAGRMLRKGVEHLREPRELIEEVMYETVLTTRLRLQRFLPFIAICAASAPLLGLLGTVTGIIGTFKLITVFGSGDVKMLSSGISEALITTKFGLIVAIPSLLLHAFLSRKARGIVNKMETSAVAVVNQISKSPLVPRHRLSSGDDEGGTGAAPDRVRAQVGQILTEMLGPAQQDEVTLTPVSSSPVKT